MLDQPGIPAQIEKGEFGELLAWQRNNIYRFGRKLLPEELVQRATGKPLNAEPYLNYLRSKYSQI